MKYSVFLFFFLLVVAATSQENYYSSPVKFPIFLSGSFAELRSNHFHSGIDIKTQQQTGHAILAVAEGFVSRVVVSPSGFGNAIYIDHPNGTTSVYAHLDKFRHDIQNYVKKLQYDNKTFRVDEKVPEDLFHVSRGEIIALSGNSGSSGGPHLHFEIRDTETEEPLNPLQFEFPVTDNIPPKLYSIQIVPLNEFSHVGYNPVKKVYQVTIQNGKYQLQEGSVVPAYGNIGIAVQANDFFDGSSNRCGIYSMRLWFDGELYYSVQMDRFSFDESRYINSYIDYPEFISSKRRYQKTWIDPGNKLSIYSNTMRGGNLKMTDGNYHPVKIELTDLAGNTAILEFTLASRYIETERTEPQYTQYMSYDNPNTFESEAIRMEIPVNALYDDLRFNYRKLQHVSPLFSDIHIIHEETVPLHNSALLSLKPENLDEKLYDKALIASVDTISEKLTSAGGIYKEGWVSTHIRNFGNYAVAVDTVPPGIIPVSFKSNGELNESARIRFRITDELSGIKEYEGLLDGEWALFEYDAKSNTIVHYFDHSRFEMGKRHKLLLKVTDNKNNESTYEASFWK